MIGRPERSERDEAAVRPPCPWSLLLLQQRSEQMHVLHRLAYRYRVDVEIVRRRTRRALHHLMRIVDRPVVCEALAPPVLVPDAELVCGFGLSEELEDIDAEMGEEDVEGRGGGLAHAHRGDLARFNDAQPCIEIETPYRVLDDEGRDPAGSPAAHDNEVRLPRHDCRLPMRRLARGNPGAWDGASSASGKTSRSRAASWKRGPQVRKAKACPGSPSTPQTP